MAISVGDAVLKLGVDTKDLDKGMKGIGATIKKHQKAIGIGMTAVGGTILAAGVLSVKKFAEMGDEIAKMARKTGFSTVTLSELRHAAELSGTSLTGLEKATKRMATSIGDFQDGLAETKRDFDKLGISIEDLEGLSPEEAFLLIGQAVGDLEDPLERAAVAQGLFGRAGMDLIPMFDKGAEALAEMRAETEDLGIVFDEVRANQAEEFTDALHRMDQSTIGVKMAIAEQLIPALMPLIDNITAIITQITTWAKENPALFKTIVTIVGIIGGLLTVLGPIVIMLPLITAGLPLLGAAFAVLLGPVGLVIAIIAALIAIGVLVWKNWDEVKAKSIEIWEGIVGFFQDVWARIKTIFADNWRTILAILFPAVGIPILIARNWNSILEYFGKVWASIQTIFAGIGQAMWRPIQQAVDFIMRYVQSVIDTIQRLWSFVARLVGGGRTAGGGGGPGAGRGFGQPTPAELEDILGESILEMHKGGIVMRPQLATIAERGPEAVIPLSKLGGLGGFKIANIIIELDGRVLASAMGQPLVDVLRLKGMRM